MSGCRKRISAAGDVKATIQEGCHVMHDDLNPSKLITPHNPDENKKADLLVGFFGMRALYLTAAVM